MPVQMYRTVLLPKGTNTLAYNVVSWSAATTYTRGGSIHGFTLPLTAQTLSCAGAFGFVLSTVPSTFCTINMTLPSKSRVIMFTTGSETGAANDGRLYSIVMGSDTMSDNMMSARYTTITTNVYWGVLSLMRTAVLGPGSYTVRLDGFYFGGTAGAAGTINGGSLNVIFWPYSS